ncbi:T9SS type A sorting domain-containing protein [Polaribacter haliotis]|uniref:T9SS type A sorting domain-containing protein n=1 Tax=Polaribacter haliotis TaxID=1888915 RepID=A0A7L8AFG7_9FLAO|nr:T9SS type A sorting domain-containing protein [Polaribacter haliotis]QOD60559.1 T9SS type A sorting domain-containing protein [Polaribacter haliotis]
MVKKILFILFLSFSFVGFSQEKSIDVLSAAPNPFTNSTKISFNSKAISSVKFTVKNVLGKTVFKKTYKTVKGKNSFQFYKDDLATGMYIYSIQDKKKVISKRFVIK